MWEIKDCLYWGMTKNARGKHDCRAWYRNKGDCPFVSDAHHSYCPKFVVAPGWMKEGRKVGEESQASKLDDINCCRHCDAEGICRCPNWWRNGGRCGDDMPDTCGAYQGHKHEN